MPDARTLPGARTAPRRSGGPAGSPTNRAWRAALPLALLCLPPSALGGDGNAGGLGPGPAGDHAGPTIEPPAERRWTGFYLGGHVGYGWGRASSFASDLASPDFTSSSATLGGGVQGGYGLELPSRLVLGVEADVSFPNFLQNGLISSATGSQGTVTQSIDCLGTVRGRIGYGWDRSLAYATGGFAWSSVHFTDMPGAGDAVDDAVRFAPGWAAGAGLAMAIDGRWTVRLEYLFAHFGRTSVSFPTGVEAASSNAVHVLRVGLDWEFSRAGAGPSPEPAGAAASPSNGSEPRWSIHGQTTLVGQGYPSFRSPYQGANSLSGEAQFAATVSATAFVGVRLWEGAELYFNPELMQGFGLSAVHGVASFPNGEAQKSDFPIPRFNVARIYLSQTFGFGGEKEPVPDGPNQIAGERDVSRLTVTVGKFSTTDFFLLNAYAGGPRTEFLSWNIYGSGSYDQTMDKLSWTWGALLELNQKDWAVRAGYFLLPVESNSNTFDTHVPQGQYMAEGEWRYALASLRGKVLVTAWLNRGNIGSYSASLAQPVTTPGYPDIALTRQQRTNYGFVAGVEQEIAEDLGVFARASWSPGLVEIMGWTDCDVSLSLGAAWRGAAWGRPRDTVGVAGVIEGLSSAARDYFAAGGLGILIGDGRLSYRPEALLEAYYSYSPWPWAWATLDYQLVVDPGYNAARGPVNVFSVRLHAGF